MTLNYQFLRNLVNIPAKQAWIAIPLPGDDWSAVSWRSARALHAPVGKRRRTTEAAAEQMRWAMRAQRRLPARVPACSPTVFVLPRRGFWRSSLADYSFMSWRPAHLASGTPPGRVGSGRRRGAGSRGRRWVGARPGDLRRSSAPRVSFDGRPVLPLSRRPITHGHKSAGQYTITAGFSWNDCGYCFN